MRPDLIKYVDKRRDEEEYLNARRNITSHFEESDLIFESKKSMLNFAQKYHNCFFNNYDEYIQLLIPKLIQVIEQASDEVDGFFLFSGEHYKDG